MQTYGERSAQVVRESSIAAMVLLNDSNTDMELLGLCPRLTPENELISAEEFADRRLRSVGVVALDGSGLPQAAFKEPLEASVISAIAAGFTEYLRVLIGQKLTEQTEAAEIAELERVYSLPDTRPN